MIFEFSKEDLLQGKIVTPGWYRVLITRVGQKPSTSQNPDTKNVFPIEGKILRNADNGSEEFAGVPTPPSWNFNDNPNAKGFVLGFAKSLGFDMTSVEKGETERARFTLKAAEGREVEVFIENDTYEGRVVNRINHKYRPLRETVNS